MIELPSQHVIAISGPPDFEEWKKRVSLASDEELKKLQMGAVMSLRGDGDGNLHWSSYIGRRKRNENEVSRNLPRCRYTTRTIRTTTIKYEMRAA
jgi:hypothetical protein